MITYQVNDNKSEANFFTCAEVNKRKHGLFQLNYNTIEMYSDKSLLSVVLCNAVDEKLKGLL